MIDEDFLIGAISFDDIADIDTKDSSTEAPYGCKILFISDVGRARKDK